MWVVCVVFAPVFRNCPELLYYQIKLFIFAAGQDKVSKSLLLLVNY